MKNIKKKLKGQSRVVKYLFNQFDVASSLSKTQASLVLHSFIATFTGNNITKHSCLNTVAKYMNKQGIIKSISTLFPPEWHSATKFGVNQILISIAMSSF